MVRMQENEMGRSVQEIALDHGGAVKKMVRLPNKNNNSNAFVVVTESCFQVWKDVSTTIAADGGPAMGSPWALKGYKDQSCRPFACNGSVAILGTDDGDGHIFNVETGEEESILSVVRVVSEIEAAAVSADGSHIVLAAGNGFLFRFLLK
jgi:hypothetical protein